ncbi:MAG: peptidoglycan editing factor PgeF [Phascolarctobacterium sp.]|nr:peptidoglycan editing factor PgeF [Phascolarctobacterium sp.]
MKNFLITNHENIWLGSFPKLSAAGFINACSLRLHGVSALKEGMFNLALHVGDEENLVLQNRASLAAALGLDAKKLTTCQQVHGANVVVITPELVGKGALSLTDTILDTDALVTNLARVPLLLFYADCTPVLLADPVTKCIGLAHAGWRGTVAKIVQKTVKTMQEAYGARPGNMLGAIGPSIGACCYEVDDFVRDKAAGYEDFFTPVIDKDGHYMLDLWGMNARLLEEAGLHKENISVSGICTACNHELFCSYRAEQGKTGRMGVCLAIE